MNLQVCVAVISLWFFTDLAVLAMRGPHHPRGQQVVRSHTHYKPMPPSGGKDHVKLTQDTQLIQDEDHIREDMSGKVSAETLKNMTPEEMEFYYFKLHDFDNDSMLDGLELLKAIDHTMHTHTQTDHGHETNEEDTQTQGKDGAGKEKHQRSPGEDLFYFTQLIDEVLLSDDTNNDGYLSYAEYTIGKRKGLSRKTGPAESTAHFIDGQTTS